MLIAENMYTVIVTLAPGRTLRILLGREGVLATDERGKMAFNFLFIKNSNRFFERKILQIRGDPFLKRAGRDLA
jgi:hypothetical protein